MFVTILGSSAKQTSKRECVSLLLDTSSETILFDTGPGIVSSLDYVSRKCSDISTLILTHVHGDHIAGFAYYIWARNAEVKSLTVNSPEQYHLSVYGKRDTLNLAKATLQMTYPTMKLSFAISFHEVGSNDSFAFSDTLSIQLIDAVHAVPTLSTVVMDGNKKFVYTSDTLPNLQLVNAANTADMLIHEGMYTQDSFSHSRQSMHSTAFDAANFARKVKAKQLILVHVAPKMFGKEHLLLTEASNEFDGVISVPCDGTVYYV